ncbi:MAG: nucleotidyltransferase domain-containing protein [Deltaproteobacteria bacterium]|nr:nucleotidyltransferase domain-containing protein [Deltaproteobacteria bacterium]
MAVEDINKTLSPVFERSGSILFAYLFGSVAKGEVTPLSDMDIAVYLSDVDPAAVFDVKLSLYGDICRALKRNDVDLVVLNTVANNMLLEDIIRHGVVIYDRDIDAREDFEVTSLHQAIDFKTQRLAVMGV